MMDTQKYPTSTVMIVIAFLAIFIIMPPLTRVLYAEEETPNVESNVEQDTSGQLICTKLFENTNLNISSTIDYDEDVVTSNVLVFKNPKNILSSEGLDSISLEEYNKYNKFLSIFENIGKDIDGDTTTITIDSEALEILNNEEFTSNYESLLSLQNSLEVDGFSCSSE